MHHLRGFLTMNKRLNELDSLRGMASFSVMIHHCLISYGVFFSAYLFNKSSHPIVNILAFSPLHILWAGHEAVIFFFLLSGFVLALPFVNNRNFKYENFVIKRFCRIYVPYAICIILSLIAFELLDSSHTENLSSWFNNMWQHPLELKELVSFVFLFGVHTSELDTTTWSLVHEMRISLFLPFILILMKRSRFRKFILISFIIYLAALLVFYYTLHIQNLHVKYDLIHSSRDTFYYTGFFVAGALLAKYMPLLEKWYYKLSSNMKISLFAVGILLYLIEWLLPHLGYLKYNSSAFTEISVNFIVDWCIGIGVAILIIISLNSTLIKDFLEKKVLIYLGEISYSLYLIHPIVLLIYVHFARGTFFLYTILLFVPIISLLAAHFMHRYIEVPSIKLGKKLIAYKPSSIKVLRGFFSQTKYE